MKKMIMLGVFLLLASAQSVCAQTGDAGVDRQKQVEEHVVLALKKYEGLGLTTEQLAEKVAADLLEKARAMQDDVALDIEDNDEEKSNSKKKWIIGVIAVVAACGIGYWAYKTYCAKLSLEGVLEKALKRGGMKINDKHRERAREYMAKDSVKAAKLAEKISNILAKAHENGSIFAQRLGLECPELNRLV